MYKNILLTVDLNHEESWRKALPAAVAASREFNARLHIITVAPDFHMPLVASYFPDDFMDGVKSRLKEELEKFVSEHVPDDVDSTHAVVHGGKIYEEIMRYANKNGVDLIVVEAFHPDLKDYLLGSNAEKIARHAKQSVLLVRE
ncbi:MAG: universal stress protein [Gammaproteobacteria bacterium]|nr:universal stress protein [Gammaproteobacteria bacterium]